METNPTLDNARTIIAELLEKNEGPILILFKNGRYVIVESTSVDGVLVDRVNVDKTEVLPWATPIKGVGTFRIH
jgi:hypothetical protein